MAGPDAALLDIHNLAVDDVDVPEAGKGANQHLASAQQFSDLCRIARGQTRPLKGLFFQYFLDSRAIHDGIPAGIVHGRSDDFGYGLGFPGDTLAGAHLKHGKCCTGVGGEGLR